MRRSRLALLAASAVTASLVAVPSAGASPKAATPRQASAAARVPAIAFGQCDDTNLASRGIQCGSLEVPMDYKNIDGPKVTLQVTRKLHTTAESKGVILTNPGGPGGDGRILPALQDIVPKGAGKAYDWIGFAPRGVAPSSPAIRCAPNYFGDDRPPYVPSVDSRMTYWKKKTAAFAAACGKTAGKELLPHLKTSDSARDMDMIRRALRAPMMNYYGFSWGTYLGATYAKMYPTKVGRFVFDGVVNPTRVWADANYDQDRAFDRNINVFFQWIAKHPGVYKLGTDWKRIRTRYYNQLNVLAKTPAADGKLGPNELTDAMLGAGYYVSGWNRIAHAFSQLLRTGNGDALYARFADGDAGDNNSYSIYSGVQCTDAPWPSMKQTISDNWQVYETAPFMTWSNAWYNFPCQTWPVAAQDKPVINGSKVTSKILLISETKDAATPYAGAVKLRSLFPTSSLIAGVGGTTHSGSLNGVPCVDDAIAAYLTSGKVPPRVSGNRSDRQCPKVAPPPAEPTERVKPAGMPQYVRNALEQAQRIGR